MVAWFRVDDKKSMKSPGWSNLTICRGIKARGMQTSRTKFVLGLICLFLMARPSFGFRAALAAPLWARAVPKSHASSLFSSRSPLLAGSKRPLGDCNNHSLASSHHFSFTTPRPLRGGSALSMSSAAGATAGGAGDRFAALQDRLSADGGVNAWLVLSGDAHNSEYPSESDLRLRAISGFTGSAGAALIAANGITLDGSDGGAVLVTDGRYSIQAAAELDMAKWGLQITGAAAPSMPQYFANALGTGKPLRVGVDATLLPIQTQGDLQKALESNGHSLVPMTENPLDAVWQSSGRPAPPSAPAVPHPVNYAGQSVEDKLADLRKAMQEEGAGALIASSLDEVNWLFNIRGSDIAHTPVCIAYALITPEQAFLYVDTDKVENEEISKHLQDSEVNVKGYSALFDDAVEMAKSGTVFWLDPASTSVAVLQAASGPEGKAPTPILKRSPILMPKAIKNPTELKCMQDAHTRDGAAMARFLCWLEREMDKGTEIWEMDVCRESLKQRSRHSMFTDLSFPTISASGPNGAINHYFVNEATNRRLQKSELFLMDSGGQYLDGTTDVTRTMTFGEATREHIESFTRVLKGHISLASACFPKGTTGYQLDVLARAPLWRQGMDYAHGTGHGVGAFLGVHEGPHGISFRLRPNEVALESGMLTSIEPGYYVGGSYGIRIENIVSVCPMSSGGGMLQFQPLTLIPFQSRLIDMDLLTHEEIAYIDEYHERVYREVSPLLNEPGDEESLEWLRKSTESLETQAKRSKEAVHSAAV